MYNRQTLQKRDKKPLKTSFFLFFILSFLLPGISNGQVIDSTGKFVPSKSNRLYYPDISLSAPKPKRDTVAEKQTKKIILEKVEKTILKLEDDSTHLKGSYIKIWGKDFYKTYLDELKLLRNYLKSGTPKNVTLNSLPQVSEIESLLKPDSFTLKTGKRDSKTKEFLLYKEDLLAKYLLGKYTNDYDADQWIKKSAINAEYLNNWRTLESWFTLSGNLHKKLDAMEQNIFDFDPTDISTISTQIKKIQPDSLSLVTWIKTSPMVKNWLWFNEGNIRINPLQSTVKDKRYPNEEPNLFFSPTQKKLQDSLEKLKAFENFATTTKTFNKIILPIKSQQCRLDTLMIQYNMVGDSLKRTDVDKNEFKDGYIKNNLQLVIPVYNIPENKTVLLGPNQKDLIYESRAITEINSMAEKLGVVTSLGLSNSATIGKITGLLNTAPIPDVNIKFPDPDNNAKLKADTESLLEPRNKKLNLLNWTGTIGQPVTAVQVGAILVQLTNKDLKEDKKRILWTSQFGEENLNSLRDIPPLFERLLQAFVEDDRYFFLDYSSMGNIIPDINKMIKRFNAFKDKIKIRAQEINRLKTLNSDKYDFLLAYVRISQRSLPPEILKAKTDTAAIYYTRIFVPEIPDAPKTISYTINEGTAGIAKLKEVDKLQFKRVKTQLFDLSVGIGYTFSDYNITSNTGSELPTTILGDKFQFQAGLHWYFIHRLNKLNDKLFKNTDERFSLYVGLSLKKALENYYTGISYDIVPGVRLIAGAHFYKNNRFKIINNAVAEKASGISYAGLFTSLNLEPLTIGKAIGLFK